MPRFKSPKHAQQFLSAHGPIYGSAHGPIYGSAHGPIYGHFRYGAIAWRPATTGRPRPMPSEHGARKRASEPLPWSLRNVRLCQDSCQ